MYFELLIWNEKFLHFSAVKHQEQQAAMAHAQTQQDPFGSAENVNQGGKDKRGKDRGNSGTRLIQDFV